MIKNSFENSLKNDKSEMEQQNISERKIEVDLTKLKKQTSEKVTDLFEVARYIAENSVSV